MAYKEKSEAARQYAEKLKDPRWKSRRMEILERDSHTCRGCGAHDPIKENLSEEEEYQNEIDPPEPVRLEVHHKYYEWGLDPWAYPNDALITLCEMCHDTETAYHKEAIEKFKRVIQTHFLSKDIFTLTHAIEHAQLPFRENKRNARLIAWILTTPEIIGFLADAFESQKSELRPTSHYLDRLFRTLEDRIHG